MKRIFVMHLLICTLYINSHCFEETKEIVQKSKLSDIKVQMLNNVTENFKSSVVTALLENAEVIIKDAKKYASLSLSIEPPPYCNKPMDCFDIKHNDPHAKNGIYKIWPRNRVCTGSIEVYCDMEDDGGAWTVIQRRGDFDSGKEYFYQGWAAYKKGFGNLSKDFWLGNDNIFALTNQKANSVKFTLRDWEGNQTYASYDEFWINDELNKYKMHVKGYRGTAGDSFSDTDGHSFTTKDQDNDTHKDNDTDDQNCAVLYKGAWWYKNCHFSNLNGFYLKGTHERDGVGVGWYEFRGYYYSLKDTVIKIRPHDFKPNIKPQ